MPNKLYGHRSEFTKVCIIRLEDKLAEKDSMKLRIIMNNTYISNK